MAMAVPSETWRGKDAPRKRPHVVWTPEERASLGRQVAEAMRKDGDDPARFRDEEVFRLGFCHLKAAVAAMPEDRQRLINGYKVVPWLPEAVRRAAARPDVLQLPGREAAPPEEPEPEPPPRESPVAAPPDRRQARIEWDLRRLQRSHRRLRREGHRLRVDVRLMHDEMVAIRESFDYMAELLVEIAPHLKLPPKPPKTFQDHWDRDTYLKSRPRVVVAGVRPRDQALITERVGEEATLTYVDPATQDPRELAAYDWLIYTDRCDPEWAKQARRCFKSRCSEAHHVSGVSRAAMKVRELIEANRKTLPGAR